ncbi:MAG: sigma-54-dependent Fis family transcriptional regulator [Planctomycetes bacterium]|nr:sigma-54-dependent Fis family transcriptional regulator [Planctomycetota bacterium]
MLNPQHVDLLVVDDDDEFRGILARRFERRGYQVQEAPGGLEALDLANRRQFDVAIVDLLMPGMSGVELLEKLKAGHSECEVILLTGQGSIESAVAAMKLGAYDYLTKPCALADLEKLIERAAERGYLAKENDQLREVLHRAAPRQRMIGHSPALREVLRLIERAGPTDKAILIQGESGTGKELVARALHQHSARADKPLVVINCAALPESLLESELFGHEKGAFTGAVTAKPGLFELADGGTLFIDEIGEMPGSLQAKLLRVLEDGSMRRVGSVKERRVNVRLLAATNRNMAEEVKAGRFREDLYYRINVMALNLPPLRERMSDIPLLVEHFLGRDWRIEPAAMTALERYQWPGNIRQLVNAVERAKIMGNDHIVRLADLPEEITRLGVAPDIDTVSWKVAGDSLEAIQRSHVIEVLRRERGNKARAARALGINRRSLYRLLEKYNLEGAAMANRVPTEPRQSTA